MIAAPSPARPAPVARAAAAAGLALCAFVTACVGARAGASDGDLARAVEATRRGARLYADACGSCHGGHGEGLAGAPAVLGPGALPEYPRDIGRSGVGWMHDPQQMQIDAQTRRPGLPWRDPFHSALDLGVFVGRHLSDVARSRAARMKPGDDWAVVAFLLAAQGGALPAEGLTAENARSVAIPRR
ncbi:MAG TPA: c-type cytochrome [Polyangiaceae bacterium]|nr:c-type cytochrome [Polyangiaceae bacterium]